MISRWVLIAVILIGMTVAAVFAFSTWTSEGDPLIGEFAVEKMTCSSCVRNIESALARVEGVGLVDVKVTSGTARVGYDPADVGPERIAAVITNAGYPARLSRWYSERSAATPEEVYDPTLKAAAGSGRGCSCCN